MNRTVYLGGVSKPELLERLKSAGVRMNALAEQLFADERFTTSPMRSLVDAVQTIVAELGLPNGGTFDEIVRHAAERGLALCPLELGPHLRLAMPDQPECLRGPPVSQNRAPDGAITVASPELSSDDEVPKGFYILHAAGVLWLRGYRSWPGHLWNADDTFVFLRASSSVD